MGSGKLGMRVRHLVRSRDESVVAAGAFECTAQVWELTHLTRVSTLNTIFDFGGKRLALSNEGGFLFAASYNKRALACYAIPSGVIVWFKAKLGAVQSVVPSVTGNDIYCELDDERCLIIDAKTGERKSELERTKEVHEDPGGNRRLLLGKKLVISSSSGEEVCLGPQQAAVLGVAYGYREVCISYAGGRCVCIDSVTGECIWEYELPWGNHVIELMFSESDNCFYGIQRPYYSGGADTLIRISKDTGATAALAFFDGSSEYVFMPVRNWLLTSEGHIVEVSAGKTISSLCW